MSSPRLTFFCELPASELQRLFAELDLADLVALKAHLSLGILDFSPERAEVVRRLNAAGIPATAWLLLPREQGYWFNAGNAAQAAQNYAEFKEWSQQNGLRWERIGLDIEPDIGEMHDLARKPAQLVPRLLRRLFDWRRARQAHRDYAALAGQIRADGFGVESYQFPIMHEERRAGSTLLRRLAGLVDVPVDTEVWMLYSSFLRPYGAGILGSYARSAQAVGVGSTGGGVEPTLGNVRPLDWDELARDLRLAWYWCDDLYIFSLEGCVRQGFLPRLRRLQFDQPILLPDEAIAFADGWRGALRTGLWVTAHLLPLLGGLAAGLLAARLVSGWLDKRRP